MKVIDVNIIPRLVEAVNTSKFSNLLISGCSFSNTDFGQSNFYFQTLKTNYKKIKDPAWPDISNLNDWQALSENIKNECIQHGLDIKYLTYITWPVYTRDLLNFDRVLDCSCSGAGNKHIHDSIILALESNPDLTSKNTQVVVMWSGYDRDDFIVSSNSVDKTNNDRYHYADDAELVLTGGLLGGSNCIFSVDVIKKIKSEKSRALENFIYIVGLYQYLKARGFSFVFTNFSTTLRLCGLEIEKYLTEAQNQTLHNAITITNTLGDYAQHTIDGTHPSSEWQHKWAENILLPELLKQQELI